MYSRQLVILFVNENGTAEKVGTMHHNAPNIESIFCLFVIKQTSYISAALKVQKLWDNASNDEDLSAVNMLIQFAAAVPLY